MASTENKVKYNLKNVYAALLTKTVEDNVTKYSYGTPKRIPGAVSLSMDPEGSSDPFYADGIVYYRTNVNNGYSGDLEIALVPEWFKEEIMQEVKDTNGVLAETANATDNKAFALLFEFDGDQKQIRHVMFNCTATRQSVSSKTKEDSVSPETETLSLSADAREDGWVKASTSSSTSEETYNAWFTKVYEPVVTP